MRSWGSPPRLRNRKFADSPLEGWREVDSNCRSRRKERVSAAPQGSAPDPNAALIENATIAGRATWSNRVSIDPSAVERPFVRRLPIGSAGIAPREINCAGWYGHARGGATSARLTQVRAL